MKAHVGVCVRAAFFHVSRWSCMEVDGWIGTGYTKDCVRWGASLSRHSHPFPRRTRFVTAPPQRDRVWVARCQRVPAQWTSTHCTGPAHHGLVLCRHCPSAGEGQATMPRFTMARRSVSLMCEQNGRTDSDASNPGMAAGATCDFRSHHVVDFFTSSFKALASDWADRSRRTDGSLGPGAKGACPLGARPMPAARRQADG